MCVVCGWFCLIWINTDLGEGNSCKTLGFWPPSNIPTDSREFKAFFLMPGWGIRNAGQKRIQDGEADERNLSSLKGDGGRWQLSNSLPQISKEKWLLSGYSSPGPKKKKNHPFPLNIKAHITLKCIWHTCQPLLIFVPSSLIYCLVLNLCVSIIVNYLSNSSFEHFW